MLIMWIFFFFKMGDVRMIYIERAAPHSIFLSSLFEHFVSVTPHAAGHCSVYPDPLCLPQQPPVHVLESF